jgi:hypothetical protein
MPDTLIKSDILTVSPLSPNTLRIALWIQQGISVNDLPPVIDLDPMAGIQSSSSVIANTAFGFSDACRLDKV